MVCLLLLVIIYTPALNQQQKNGSKRAFLIDRRSRRAFLLPERQRHPGKTGDPEILLMRQLKIDVLSALVVMDKLMFVVVGARDFSPEITVLPIGTEVPCFDRVPPQIPIYRLVRSGDRSRNSARADRNRPWRAVEISQTGCQNCCPPFRRQQSLNSAASGCLFETLPPLRR